LALKLIEAHVDASLADDAEETLSAFASHTWQEEGGRHDVP